LAILFCFGGVRVGQSFVLFWWGSCWAILFCFGGVRVGKSSVLFWWGSCLILFNN
jgi:hypothetical protein